MNSTTGRKRTVKRIAAVAAGAALLGAGIAFASVSFQSIPIINNSGQPVVQIAVGATAAPSDGVAAANIAAAIGNLAATQASVSVTVNRTAALKVLSVSVASPHYALSNAQVWLNKTGTTVTSGSYPIYALIGSVLNRGTTSGGYLQTKYLSGSTSYGYPENNSLQSLSPFSVYNHSIVGTVPFVSVSPSSNGGGVSFTGLTNSSSAIPTHPPMDNILRLDSTQLPSLMSNSGANGESEYLWVSGFPVFDQQTGTLALVGPGAAYQAVFSTPIKNRTSSNSINTASIQLLGQNWVILNYTSHSVGAVAANHVAFGGKLELASALSNMTTVYVGQGITSGPFNVTLKDVGFVNQNGTAPAILDIYYNGVLTNETSVFPSTTAHEFNVSGHRLYVKVNQTAAGIVGVGSRWAKLQLYSNVFNITSGKPWNTTYDPGWEAEIGWVNSSAQSIGQPNALQQIAAYNTSPEQALQPGQSINIIQSPAAYSLTFVGETLGTGSFDAVTASTTYSNSVTYENNNVNTGSGLGNINNITEPAQELVVTSQIPNAFSFGGQTAQSVTYDLTPYQLNESGVAPGPANARNNATYINYKVATTAEADLVNQNYTFTITAAGSPASGVTSFPANSTTVSALSTGFSDSFLGDYYNITKIQLSHAIPGLNVTITANGIYGAAGSKVLAILHPIAPQVLYSTSGKAYDLITSGSSVLYNQQNGQPQTTFALNNVSFIGAAGHTHEFAAYRMNESAVPGQSNIQDQLSFGIYNSSIGRPAIDGTLFQLNQTPGGTSNNMTYNSTSVGSGSIHSVNAKVGFRTERGSKVASISPTSLTIDFAKSVDSLEFVAAPFVNASKTSSTTHTYGPFAVGQAVNIPGVYNLSVAKINASIALSGTTNYTIHGIHNLTAAIQTTPKSYETPVSLQSMLTSTTPLVVLANASTNPGSSLILIGSGYVNQLTEQYCPAATVASITPTSVLVQPCGNNKIVVAGYTAAQTTQASTEFINDLYTAAASTS